MSSSHDGYSSTGNIWSSSSSDAPPTQKAGKRETAYRSFAILRTLSWLFDLAVKATRLRRGRTASGGTSLLAPDEIVTFTLLHALAHRGC